MTMRSRNTYLVSLLACAAALTACGEDETKSQNEVNLYTVSREDLPINVKEGGELVAVKEVEVKSQIEGNATVGGCSFKGAASGWWVPPGQLSSFDPLAGAASCAIPAAVRPPRSTRVAVRRPGRSVRRSGRRTSEAGIMPVRRCQRSQGGSRCDAARHGAGFRSCRSSR